MSSLQDLHWDSKPARFSPQLWQLGLLVVGPAAPTFFTAFQGGTLFLELMADKYA